MVTSDKKMMMMASLPAWQPANAGVAARMAGLRAVPGSWISWRLAIGAIGADSAARSGKARAVTA